MLGHPLDGLAFAEFALRSAHPQVNLCEPFAATLLIPDPSKKSVLFCVRPACWSHTHTRMACSDK